MCDKSRRTIKCHLGEFELPSDINGILFDWENGALEVECDDGIYIVKKQFDEILIGKLHNNDEK